MIEFIFGRFIVLGLVENGVGCVVLIKLFFKFCNWDLFFLKLFFIVLNVERSFIWVFCSWWNFWIFFWFGFKSFMVLFFKVVNLCMVLSILLSLVEICDFSWWRLCCLFLIVVFRFWCSWLWYWFVDVLFELLNFDFELLMLRGCGWIGVWIVGVMVGVVCVV